MTETYFEIKNGKRTPIEFKPHEVLAFVPCGHFTEVYLQKKFSVVIDVPYHEFKKNFVKEEWIKKQIYSEGEI